MIYVALRRDAVHLDVDVEAAPRVVGAERRGALATLVERRLPLAENAAADDAIELCLDVDDDSIVISPCAAVQTDLHALLGRVRLHDLLHDGILIRPAH